MRESTFLLGPSSSDHQNAGKISIFLSLSPPLSLSSFSFFIFFPFSLFFLSTETPFFFCLLLSSFPFHFPFSLISLIFYLSFIFSYISFSFFLHFLFSLYLILIIRIGQVGKLPPHFPSLTHVILSNFLIFMIFSPIIPHFIHGSM